MFPPLRSAAVPPTRLPHLPHDFATHLRNQYAKALWRHYGAASKPTGVQGPVAAPWPGADRFLRGGSCQTTS